jgi:hypothetical protein
MSSPILAALLLLALNGAAPLQSRDAAPEAVVVAAENPQPDAPAKVATEAPAAPTRGAL